MFSPGADRSGQVDGSALAPREEYSETVPSRVPLPWSLNEATQRMPPVGSWPGGLVRLAESAPTMCSTAPVEMETRLAPGAAPCTCVPSLSVVGRPATMPLTSGLRKNGCVGSIPESMTATETPDPSSAEASAPVWVATDSAPRVARLEPAAR